MGIFGNYAGKYRDAGYSPIPVMGKRPVLQGWSRFCRKRADDDEFNTIIKEYDTCGIGIACGPASGGLVFVDIDAPDKEFPEVINAIRDAFPPTPVERVGSKGVALAYRCADATLSFPQITCKRSDGTSVVLFEIIRNGKQIVIPPSVHPDTKKPYLWLGDDLMEYTPGDLPTITMEMFERARKRVASIIDAKPGYSMESDGPGISGVYQSPDGVRCPHGSHDRLKSIANAMIYRGESLDTAVRELIAYDKTHHKGVSYFSDKRTGHDFKYDPYTNALRFYVSNFLSAAERAKHGADNLPIPGGDDLVLEKKYPSIKTHFYFTRKDDEGKVKIVGPDYDAYAAYFTDKYNAVTVAGGRDGQTFTYNGKFYQPLFPLQFRKTIRRDTNQRVKPQHVPHFFSTMQSESEGIAPETPVKKLNLANGILDLNTGKLLKHSPKYHFKYVIDNLEYDKSARADKWEWFLNDVMEGDAERIRILRLFVAYTLMGGYPFLHQALCLKGGGRNGKGVFVDVIKTVLGKANIANIPMRELSNRFKRIFIYGKLANFDEESSDMESDLFKNLVSGGSVVAEYKGKDGFEFQNECRLVMLFNDTPKLNDKSRGVLDRLLIVPFDRYYAPGERDPGLRDTLYKETPGILNWAVDAVEEVAHLKSIPMCSAMEGVFKDYREESDSAYFFFNERVEFDRHNGLYITFDSVYGEYKLWAERSGIRPMGGLSFAKAFKSSIGDFLRNELMRDVPIDDVCIRNRRQRGYRYLRVKSVYRDGL